MEPVLIASSARVEIVLSAEAALAAMITPQPPSLALLDADLPGMEPGMNAVQLLAAVRASTGGHRFPIVLISDEVSEEWCSRLAQGISTT
jgi:CheY-like chemotaxis protein